MMYWSGTLHFSHEKENVVEKLQAPEPRWSLRFLTPVWICFPFFCLFLTSFSLKITSRGRLQISRGKNTLFHHCFEAPLTRTKTVFWIKIDTFANLCVPWWDPLQLGCIPYVTGMVTKGSTIILLPLGPDLPAIL